MAQYREEVVTTTTTAPTPQVPAAPITVNNPWAATTQSVEQVTVDPFAARRMMLYRLQQAATEDLRLDELGAPDGVLAIEWPDRLTHVLPGACVVEIEIVDETTRRVTIAR